MNQTPHYLNRQWRYMPASSHSSAEEFRRRQEQRQREVERERREAEERSANEDNCE